MLIYKKYRQINISKTKYVTICNNVNNKKAKHKKLDPN